MTPTNAGIVEANRVRRRGWTTAVNPNGCNVELIALVWTRCFPAAMVISFAARYPSRHGAIASSLHQRAALESASVERARRRARRSRRRALRSRRRPVRRVHMGVDRVRERSHAGRAKRPRASAQRRIERGDRARAQRLGTNGRESGGGDSAADARELSLRAHRASLGDSTVTKAADPVRLIEAAYTHVPTKPIGSSRSSKHRARTISAVASSR